MIMFFSNVSNSIYVNSMYVKKRSFLSGQTDTQTNFQLKTIVWNLTENDTHLSI